MRQQDTELEATQSLQVTSPYGLRALLGIRRYVTEQVEPDDIIHAHLFPPFYHLAILKWFGDARCRLVFTEHSTSNRRRSTTLGHMLDFRLYANYEQVITVSQGAEQELLKWQPSLTGKTRVVTNGVSLFYNRVIQRPFKTRLKIVSVGHLRRAKNYDTALRAVALLSNLDFDYEIAGEGDCRAELLRLRKELGLETKVRFLGHVRDIPELLASADIFLMPSRWEGFGLAAVEAMNASLPLVVSDVAGLREIVNGAEPGALLVDPQSPASIAKALSRLLTSSDLRQQLGENSFYQSQRYSIAQMVEKHIKVYDELT